MAWSSIRVSPVATSTPSDSASGDRGVLLIVFTHYCKAMGLFTEMYGAPLTVHLSAATTTRA